MRCQFCGAGIVEGAEFCHKCGARAPQANGESAPASGSAIGEAEARRDLRPTGASAYGAVPGDPLPSFGEPAGAGASAFGGGAASAAGGYAQREPWAEAYIDRDPTAPSMVDGYRYAGFWVRAGAYLLDFAFSLLIALAPAILAAILFYNLVESAQDPAFTEVQRQQNEDDAATGAAAGFIIVWALVWLAYAYIGTALGGALGMRLTSIRVVKEETGERPGFGAAALRVGATVLLSIINVIQLLDYAWMIWDRQSQTLHDKVAGTVVVKV